MTQENDGRNARSVWRGIAADMQVQVRVPVFVAIVELCYLIGGQDGDFYN